MSMDEDWSIHWPRLLLAVIAALVASFVLFGASFFVVPVDMIQWQAEHGRPQGDPLRVWGTVGHVLEVAILALGYFIFVRSRRVATGIVYGLIMMSFLSASDLTVLAAFEAASPPFTFWMIPVNLVVGAVSGWILAKLYRPRTAP